MILLIRLLYAQPFHTDPRNVVVRRVVREVNALLKRRAVGLIPATNTNIGARTLDHEQEGGQSGGLGVQKGNRGNGQKLTRKKEELSSRKGGREGVGEIMGND